MRLAKTMRAVKVAQAKLANTNRAIKAAAAKLEKMNAETTLQTNEKFIQGFFDKFPLGGSSPSPASESPSF